MRASMTFGDDRSDDYNLLDPNHSNLFVFTHLPLRVGDFEWEFPGRSSRNWHERPSRSIRRLVEGVWRSFSARAVLRKRCLYVVSRQVVNPGCRSTKGYSLAAIRSSDPGYASVVGDEENIQQVRRQLRGLGFQPDVFKKSKKQQKAKGTIHGLPEPRFSG